MNITFLIGNGFDLNINMKTRYSNFYDYYLKINHDNPLIQKLKKDLKNWSDLEFALGQYTSNFQNFDEVEIIYENICEELAQYLNEEENKYSIENLNPQTFTYDLVFPERHLVLGDKNRLTSYQDNWSNFHWNINIITFNYTSIIEKITNFKKQSIRLHDHHNRQSHLNKILHVHGYTNDGMILGVNDTTQISNEDLHAHQAQT